jgi:hypothetical protein
LHVNRVRRIVNSNIQHTTRYTDLTLGRFKAFWQD